MNQQYNKTNTFAIFINDRKEPGSKQPDRTGTLNVDGVEYFIDGWLGKTQAGATYLQGKIKRKDKQPERQQAPRQATQSAVQKPSPASYSQGSGFESMEDDVPF